MTRDLFESGTIAKGHSVRFFVILVAVILVAREPLIEVYLPGRAGHCSVRDLPIPVRPSRDAVTFVLAKISSHP